MDNFSMREKFVVITTINKITEGINKFSKNNSWNLLIVSDAKTPEIVLPDRHITVLDINLQNKMDYKFTKLCPFNHYSRKNIGYIYAIRNGALKIFDTDDDNIPYENWYNNFDLTDEIYDCVMSPKYLNIYKLFTDKYIWPRGFPLDEINNRMKIHFIQSKEKKIAIIQGLADGDPDVDAIYRMIIGEHVIFNKRPPVILSKGVYCPINSQSTLWLKDAFVFLYLPISVSFRFTDILRGYIAQRGIYEIDRTVAFIKPSVFQKRNAHSLMKDFADEIECYLNVKKLISILDNVSLTGTPTEDIRIIYKNLFTNGIVEEVELRALDAWINDIGEIK